MQIVINMDENNLTKEEIEACIKLAKTDFSDVAVLPKGHGDLIDRNVVYAEFNNADLSSKEMIGKLLVFGIPAVIPADK